ncbi:hypothetical protein PYW08_012352 [Mythimna loreyi]|uniref:Uncharacterized protein n=7 Tax=Mythimna loreyi TaxID=667449 RepID=A0ACC2Q3I4_9NEOP|nr:hypothetical protein PYW08_012341 [Mythimna loreyi]KAJ8705023.1 hypothetical protein PYW08_012343 [Mythimna loreyi]KAJ8705027.1 hypothetical protein PYW08_012347 [Mythimna loreyi]KAJ8705028.1 hypothetical protein PYW08_012348 [Mythimna loreyi]KAJ8705029.1 hypothetical protein PYW08_012349 [Mythimna loreyi]
MRTEHLDQASFCPFAPREVSVLAELALGHLRYSLTDVPPQSNYPPGSVLEPDHAGVVRRRALPPRRHSARLERNTVRPPILSTAHRFRPTEAALSSNPTLRRVPLAAILRRYGPGTLYGKTAPFKTNLDRSDRDEKAEPPEHHISRRLNNGGIQCWASFLFARRY